MDIVGKILQALLGGERPRTWVDLAIVLAICVTYALTQAMRFLHHHRHREAIQSATSPQQLDALKAADPGKPPKSAGALIVLVVACAGLHPAQLQETGSATIQGAVLPICFVRNRFCTVDPSPRTRPALSAAQQEP